MSDVHTFPINKFHFVDSPILSLKTSNAEIVWQIKAKPGLQLILKVQNRDYADVQVKAPDGTIELGRRIWSRASGKYPFTSAITIAKERVLFKYAWPPGSASSESHERFQIRLADSAAGRRIGEILAPFFKPANVSTAAQQRLPVIGAAGRQIPESQPLPGISRVSGSRQVSRERSRERSYTQTSDRSTDASSPRRRDARSASPVSDPNRITSRYRETPPTPSVDDASHQTARQPAAMMASVSEPGTPDRREANASDTSDVKRQSESLERVDLQKSPLLTLQQSPCIGDRSLDETEEQIDIPAIEPTSSQPLLPDENLIDLASSPPLPLLSEIGSYTPMRLRTTVFKEDRGDGMASESPTGILHPTSRTHSGNISTRSPESDLQPNYNITTEYSYNVPLPIYPPMLPVASSAAPHMPAGQRLYDLRADHLEMQIEAIMRERGLEDLVMRIGDILARRKSLDADRIRHYAYQQHGHQQYPPRHQELVFPRQSFFQATGSQHSQQPVDFFQSFQYAEQQALYPGVFPPSHQTPHYHPGQAHPAWDPQFPHTEYQQHPPLSQASSSQVYNSDEGDTRTADTTLDDDFDAQMNSF